MPASARTAPNYDLLWPAFKRRMRELLEATQLSVCLAGGDTIEAFAREALTRQGKWFAIQDILGLISQLEEEEREGSLTEDDDAPD